MVSSRQILGIRFFNGDVEEAVGLMLQRGGLLVAPSGTCFARLREDETYRRAVACGRSGDCRQRFDGTVVALAATTKGRADFGLQVFETSARQIERRREPRRVLGSCGPNTHSEAYSIGRAAKVSPSPRRIVMSRRGTDRKSKIEIFLRCLNSIAPRMSSSRSAAARKKSSDILCGKICRIGRRSIASVLHSDSSQAIRFQSPTGRTDLISAGSSACSRSRVFSSRGFPALSSSRG